MEHIVLPGVLGLAFGTLQLLLMRRVLAAQKGWQRVLLLLLKLPLWALAFIGMALWWGVLPLLAFGAAAGATYLFVAIIYYSRTHRAHREDKGE